MDFIVIETVLSQHLELFVDVRSVIFFFDVRGLSGSPLFKVDFRYGDLSMIFFRNDGDLLAGFLDSLSELDESEFLSLAADSLLMPMSRDLRDGAGVRLPELSAPSPENLFMSCETVVFFVSLGE